jgi:DNA photolyase
LPPALTGSGMLLTCDAEMSRNEFGFCCCNQVVPLFCFDPSLFGTTRWGNPKTGPFRSEFLLESVAALRTALVGIGSDLLTTNSTPGQTISGKSLFILRPRVSESYLTCC